MQEDRAMVLGTAGSVVLGWRADTLEQICKLQAPCEVRHVYFSRDASVVLGLVGRDRVLALDLGTPQKIWEKETESWFTAIVCVGKCFFVGTLDGFVCMWKGKTGSEQWSVEVDELDGIQAVEHIYNASLVI